MDAATAQLSKDIELGTELPFRVGRASIDPVSREARFDAQCERLQPQNLKVLVALVRSSGKVVSRGDLIDLCWGGRIVGEDVINRSISMLRQFSDRAGGFTIETVPRVGYRLHENRAPEWLARIGGWRVTAIAIVALVAAAVLFVRSERNARTPPPQPPTIAVLPFTADSPDADARRIASRAHDTLIRMLSQSAYQIAAVDSAGPNGGTRPDFVLSGQVGGSPGWITASVKMEDPRNHTIVFSHEFAVGYPDRWQLADQVGAQVTSQIGPSAQWFAIDRNHVSDPAFITSIFQAGWAGLGPARPLQDYQALQRVAAANPDSPLAQIAFANAAPRAMDQMPLDQRMPVIAAARVAEARTIRLAPNFGDGYFTWCSLHSEQRMVQCEDALRTGMRIDSDSTWASEFLAAFVLEPAGRLAEARQMAALSLAHDPYMPVKIANMLRLFEITGDTRDAADLNDQSSRWWPRNGFISWFRLAGMIARGDFQAAQHFAREVGQPIGSSAALVAINAKSLPAMRSACASAQDLEGVACMLAFGRMGDLDSAFALADRIYPSRRGRTLADEERIWLANPDPTDVTFLTGPAAAPLRRDSRYLDVANRVGLLEYWRSGRLPDFCTAAHEPICARIARR